MGTLVSSANLRSKTLTSITTKEGKNNNGAVLL